MTRTRRGHEPGRVGHVPTADEDGGPHDGKEPRVTARLGTAVPRLVPDEAYPPYTFVPGRSPHPTADPAGHSFGVTPALPPAVEPDRWQQCRPYLVGIDLFNGGYFWESHVAWESLWLACGRRSPVADFLKGLIHLAAAGVKALEGRPRGVQSHSGRAAELWRGVGHHVGTETDLFMGFRIGELIGIAEAIHHSGWPAQPFLLKPTGPT